MRLLVERPQLHRVCLSLTWYNLSREKGGLYSHAHKQFLIVFITGRTDSCHKVHVCFIHTHTKVFLCANFIFLFEAQGGAQAIAGLLIKLSKINCSEERR